jgi:hypothetical protein
MRPVTLSRSLALLVLGATFALGGCATATTSLVPTSPTPSIDLQTPDPSPTPAPARPTPTPTPLPRADNDQTPVHPQDYGDVPVVLEMSWDCGLCGPERWIGNELPRFRLYEDGLAVYRSQGDPAWMAPYHFVRLDADDVEFLLRYALDEGGLRGAARRYPGNADDAGSTRFVLHGWPVDADDVDVVVEPVIGGGTTDVDGRPIEDLPRGERFSRLEELLTAFDNWALTRGRESTPYDPGWYTAAIVEPSADDEGAPWPWDDPAPSTFAPAGFGLALAKVTTEQAEHAGSGPGGGYFPYRDLGDGRIATLLIRPILPGDDRPGAFGVRPNTLAVTVEPDLRVRSLPEVSDASVKYKPLLDKGDALYVISGPVEGSGYGWYEVYAPRIGLTGWVAVAAKTGEPWIEPVPVHCTIGASHEKIVDQVGQDLMHLVCYSGVELSGTYRLAPYKQPLEFELTCPDQEWIREPAWLNTPLSCFYDFGPDHPDTGGYDLPAGGVLHPSLADAPGELLDTHPDGLLVTVTGQLDHPDSRGCTPNGTDPILFSRVPLMCRATFVITELRPAG